MSDSEAALLPRDVRPLKYLITLAPDLERFTFSGQESVDLEVARPCSELVFHAADLEVQDASLSSLAGGSIPVERSLEDKASETVTLHLGRPLPEGRAVLTLRFRGQLGDTLRGFYRSRYQGPDGQQRYLAVTQFEPTDARRAFPCWDEPAIKARFEVALVIPSGLTAVSNTPVTSETEERPGVKRVRFAETPAMSTYLLAFLVGDLDSVQARASNGTLVRVWTTSGKAEQGRYALETSLKLLDYFNGYFGIPYPLSKLDHIAIPDFAAGAMENWGAITYRETALLVDPQNSSASTRQRVAEVVAHEMAHQWFGDLVTMAWWDDLWLNESFATWMGTKAVGHLYPEWEMWEQFVADDVIPGLKLDGLKNTHPIEARVRHPAEVQELFDAISYSKGAAVLRMLEQFLGEGPFRAGLRRYLAGHQYGNARTQDLWQALEETSGQPVRAVMDSWVRREGHPLVETSFRRGGARVEVQLSQRRFFYLPSPGQGPRSEGHWQVPVALAASGSPERVTTLLTGPGGRVVLDTRAPARPGGPWVKVNLSQTGFYRVNYPAREWARLTAAVRSQELPAADRLGLLSDSYALARAGTLPASVFLKLAGACRGERSYSVWSDLASNVHDLELLLCGEPYFPGFRAFVRRLFRPAADWLGWDAMPGEGHLHALLRSTVLGRLGAADDASVLREARHRFQRFLEDPSSLHPDLRALTYGLAAQGGDASTYEALRVLERRAALHEEKVRLLLALARFPQRELLERALELSLSPEVRSQDTVALVSAVAANPHAPGRDLAWGFVKARWREFDRRYGSGGFAIMRLVAITGNFTRPEEGEDVRQFFQANPVPAAARTVQQSLERIGLNGAFLDRNRQELARLFVRRSGDRSR